MIELFYFKIPPLENIKKSKHFLIKLLPDKEYDHYLYQELNKYQLSSFFGKIILYWLAKQKIDNFSSPPLSYHKKGKPYFKEYPLFYFNISHSNDYIIIGMGDSELGVDIEKKRIYDPALAKRFLHPDEFSFIESAIQEKKAIYFSKIWNVKESYVKYTGDGIANTFKTFSIEIKQDSSIIFLPEIIDGKSPIYFKQYQDISNYYISVCSNVNVFSPPNQIELKTLLFD